MTRAELATLLARNPQLSVAHDPNPAGPPIQPARPKSDSGSALERAVPRTVKSLERITVCFTGYRVRPKDPDNFAGSCKHLLDGLRHAGLIHNDSPESITFTVEQEKVSRRKDERTEILISIP